MLQEIRHLTLNIAKSDPLCDQSGSTLKEEDIMDWTEVEPNHAVVEGMVSDAMKG